MTTSHLGRLAMAAIIAAMILVPVIQASEESLNLVSLILIWALFAIGFDLIFGMAGMLSFCYAALFGSGGYALTLLVTKAGGAEIRCHDAVMTLSEPKKLPSSD